MQQTVSTALQQVQQKAIEQIPRWRGLIHARSVWAAAVASIILVILASDATARVAAVIYGLGLCCLFGVSGTYHRWDVQSRWKAVWRRCDHSTIFVFIAASSTPAILLCAQPPFSTILLVAVWTVAAAGIAFRMLWMDAPRGLTAGSYIAAGLLGGLAVLSVSWLPLLLIAVGGGLYVLGAVVYATKWPNPWPSTFGFHEVFHTLVTGAAAVHFVAMAGWIIPLG